MDPKQALVELGLEAPTSAEAIRRAYLRSVRKHPPERDPDGFQRVRAAYDLLRDAPWYWGEQVEVAAPISVPRAPELPAPAERAAKAALESALESLEAEERQTSTLFAIPDDEPPPPAPWRDVEDTLKLLEQGKVAEARQLSQSLERRTTELGMRPREIGVNVIARWSLVTELLALEGAVPAELIRALAMGVRSGDFLEAHRLRQEGGWRLRRALAAKAPSLNRALVAPFRVPRFKPGFTRWSWIWIGWVALQASRACFGPLFDTEQHTPVAQITATANTENGKPAAAAPAQERLVAAARAVDNAVLYGDCNTVREEWPFYARGVREAGFAWSRDNYIDRRKRALDICSELSGELPEVP